MHRKYEINVIEKRLLQKDLVLSLTYLNIRIEMTLKITRSLGLISIDIDLDHVFIQKFLKVVNKGFDNENTPIKGENKNDFKKYMYYDFVFKLFSVLYRYMYYVFGWNLLKLE